MDVLARADAADERGDARADVRAADPRTHDVTNQPPALVDYDLFASDPVLQAAVNENDAAWAAPELGELGRRAGSAEAIAWGFEANRYPPELRAFDRFGSRIDEVAYHPSYHRLSEVATNYGLHSSSWSAPRPGAHVARAAGFILWSQVEAGHGCPISMTHAVVPALRRQSELARVWEPLIFARSYDGTLKPATEKGSALFGMAMTEKQGGSDVRANTTRATAVAGAGSGGEYRLIGHKWFCSAPMSDAFLVLAQAPAGLSCFLVPRILPDGTRNAFALQRLKEKLGNRSNASAEIEFDGTTLGWLVGEEGRGVQTIVEMVNFTRLDCALGAASGMRQVLVQAIHHARHRSAFGKLLAEQPLMQNVLADLALESEAATLVCLRLARACDRADDDPQESAVKRIGTALAKFWICKRAAPHAAEALECLGGNGYVEESIMPRLFRESPLNSIWEGSGNVNALDVLRAMRKEPGILEAFFAEVDRGSGANASLDSSSARLRAQLQAGIGEAQARDLVEQMALVFGASLVVRQSPAFVADAFCRSRLGGEWGRSFGTLAANVDTGSIVQRAFPAG